MLAFLAVELSPGHHDGGNDKEYGQYQTTTIRMPEIEVGEQLKAQVEYRYDQEDHGYGEGLFVHKCAVLGYWVLKFSFLVRR